MPFVSHKLNIPWQRDTVYKFDNAYVHEFPDRSLLLVITEFTEWQIKVVDGYLEYQQYVWKPKIANIKRPVQNISLVGTITTIHNNSGLVKDAMAASLCYIMMHARINAKMGGVGT